MVNRNNSRQLASCAHHCGPESLSPFPRTPEVIAVIIILIVSKEAKPRKDKYLAQTSCSGKSLDSAVTEFMLATVPLRYDLILTTQQYGVGSTFQERRCWDTIAALFCCCCFEV